MLIDFIIGGSAAVISRTVTAPLELYRIQRQNYFIPNATIKDVLKKEGVRFLWKGNYANCIRAFPQFAINHEIYMFTSNNDKVCETITSKTQRNLICGMFSGCVSMICIYPLETIKTHLSLQTNKSHYGNIVEAFNKLKYRKLYYGLNTSMVGFGMYSSLLYTVNNLLRDTPFFKEVKNDKKETNGLKVIMGGIAGVTAISVTYPTDLIRRRLQLQGFDPTVPKYNGFFDCGVKIVKTDGIKGLYKGYAVNVFKTFFMTGVQFWAMDKLSKFK